MAKANYDYRIKGIEAKKVFNEACKLYTNLFAKKEEMEFDGWVGNSIGGRCYMNDIDFSFDDIRYSIDNDLPKGLIVEWHHWASDRAIEQKPHINLNIYCRGFKGIK